MGFDKLLEIIRKAQLNYPGFSKRLSEAQALGRWEKAVGPQIAKHSRAIRVQDSVLWVEVDHPIWKSELHHRKRQILDLLNGKLSGEKAPPGDSEVLKDIFFLDPRAYPRT